MWRSLALLENRLQRLIEGAAAWFVPGSNRQSNISHQLIEAMHSNIKPAQDGTLYAPGLYILCLSPANNPSPREWQALHDNLLNFIIDTAQVSGYTFRQSPSLNLEIDTAFPAGVFSVRAIDSQADLTPTGGIDISKSGESKTIPKNAFLIINGVEIFNLIIPVVNIGRRSDNHLVLDDPGVSRLHAQIRALHGDYVLFDLDSARGTVINNQKVHQKILQPGDVIMLGHIPLVYGQEQEETGPIKPPS
jgi:hypothetical protein